MGIYTSKPVTDKDISDEEYKFLKCGSCSMQGWRTAQEDAHNALLDFDRDSSFFAVYDGHGGHEVAEYTALHFPEHLLGNAAYQKGDYAKALVQSFLEFDEHLLEPEILALLKKIASSKKGEAPCESTDSEDQEDVNALRREADMPIDEVLAGRYAAQCSSNRHNETGVSPNITTKRMDQGTSKSPLKIASLEDGPLDDSKPSCSSSNSSTSSSNLDSAPSNECDSVRQKSQCSAAKSEEINCKTSCVKKEIIVNGIISKEGESESCSIIRTGPNLKINGEVESGDAADKDSDDSEGGATSNGDAHDGGAESKPNLVVEGRRIIPTRLPSSASAGHHSSSSTSYTGKGRCGGGGGKVKGTSSVTTASLHAPVSASVVEVSKRGSHLKRAAVAAAKRTVLDDQDMDSDEEDDEDETFAIDGMDAELEEEEEDDSSDDNAGGVEEEESVECEEEEDEDDEIGLSSEDANVYNEFYANMPDGPGFDSGCTACVALLHNQRLFVANVGDSRCVVSRAGVAVDMSIDHKPEDEIETNRIMKAGGKVTEDGRVNGGLNLSRALGDHGYKQNNSLTVAEQMISPLPDVKVLNLNTSDDFIIIACDGIWNSLSSQEAVDFVAKQLKEKPDMKLSTVCAKMFEHCLAPDLDGDGTGCDNMTCIIVSIEDKSAFRAPQPTDEVQDVTVPLDLLVTKVVEDADAEEKTSTVPVQDKVKATKQNGAEKKGNDVELKSGKIEEKSDVTEKATNTKTEQDNKKEKVTCTVEKSNGVPGVAATKAVGLAAEGNTAGGKRFVEEVQCTAGQDDRPGKRAKLDKK